MKLLTTASALGALITATSASPAPDALATARTPSPDPADYKQYYLKTQLLPGQKNARFNNLYVQLFHTGAGLNAAVLGKERVETAYLNGTDNLFKVNEDDQAYVTYYGTVMTNLAENAGWEPVHINLGCYYGDECGRFFINETGLQWSSDPGHPRQNIFAGWRVCDWWYNVPELFWKQKGFVNDSTIPSSCSDVYLMPEYV